MSCYHNLNNKPKCTQKISSLLSNKLYMIKNDRYRKINIITNINLIYTYTQNFTNLCKNGIYRTNS